MTARCLAVAAILGTGLAGRPAHAQARQHDGIFVRFLVGPAGLTSENASESIFTYAYRGGGVGFAVAVGSTISRSLVLYGQVLYDYAEGPLEQSNGRNTYTAEGYSERFDGLGPGITYYLPSNLYLGATLMVTGIRPAPGDGTGIGGSAIVGKEWWVSDRWGLGLAGQVFMGSDHLPGYAVGTWTGGGAMLALSASYN